MSDTWTLTVMGSVGPFEPQGSVESLGSVLGRFSVR